MCDFFSDNSTAIGIAFIGAFFGFGLTSLIQAFVISHNKDEEKEKLKEEMENKVRYFTLLLEEIVSKTKNQSDLVQDCIKAQQTDLINPQPMKKISTSFFQRIRNIDSRGVFEALSEKFKDDKDWLNNYTALNSRMDFIEGVLTEELPRINKNTLDKSYSKLLEVKEIVDELPNIMVQILIAKDKIGLNVQNDMEYQIIKQYYDLFITLSQNSNGTITAVKDQIIEPMKIALEPYQRQIYIQNILMSCVNILVGINDVSRDNNLTVQSYIQIVEALKDPISKIEEMITEVKTRTSKL